MAEVLLTHSNHLYSDRKQVEKMQPYPPLQTILASAMLRRHGFETALFDPTLVDAREAFSRALETHQPRLVVVCEDDFNFLSKMCLTRNRELAFWMARQAMEHGVEAVVHGSDASDHAAGYLAAGFAAVLIGEVEQTLLEVVRDGIHGGVSGLAYRGERGIEYSPPRALLENLDELPAPAWDQVDIEVYRQAWVSRHGYFSLNMASSRGCPYRCNWCAKPVYGNSYHVRAAASVAAEMLYLKQAFRPDHIWFADDIFALSPKWTQEFAGEVERLGARLPFKMQSRSDLMTRDTAGALYRAGCKEVWMGAESGSQRILDAMDKGIRVPQIYEARRNLARHNIRACFFLQFGYPGETWSDIQATISMVRETAPNDIGVSVSYPLPGTKFHQIVAAQLGANKNWAESGDLMMMFRGTYSTEFYRALAEALHREVRGEEGVETAWRNVRQLRELEEREASAVA
ncbi:MAG: radical SAM protein [Acidobacteria bacterium]|nr:radical SAM protein [Acidobacteriota bacterium]